MPWVEKYRPKKFSDLKGQELAISKVKTFLSTFPKKKSIIFHGPPGTGKTTIAHVVAKEYNMEIFELNASDLRNKNMLESTLKPAIEQKSLTKSKKLILIDEVDGISGTDRGGIATLLGLLEKSKYPVIITANNIWDKKFNVLRKKSELVQIKEISYRVVKDVLISILRQENAFVENDILTSISIKAKGDLRAAINDLQTASKLKDVTAEHFDERNKEGDIFNVLRMIFKGKPGIEMLNLFDTINLPLDQILLWIEENIPSEYQGKELVQAYEYLSKADVFKGRIYKQQYWRFLVYENILLSYGIAASKKPGKNVAGFTSYKKPERILKIWMSNQRNAKKKSISQKYAKLVHVGEKRAMSEFQILKPIIQSNPDIQKELKLTDDELEFLER